MANFCEEIQKQQDVLKIDWLFGGPGALPSVVGFVFVFGVLGGVAYIISKIGAPFTLTLTSRFQEDPRPGVSLWICSQENSTLRRDKRRGESWGGNKLKFSGSPAQKPKNR